MIGPSTGQENSGMCSMKSGTPSVRLLGGRSGVRATARTGGRPDFADAEVRVTARPGILSR